jgi:hypothetical protein
MFKLQPKPTFRAKVPIPVPGGVSSSIELEFRHMARGELRRFLDNVQEREDLDVLMEVVLGWSGVDAEFSRESMATLLENYPASAAAVLAAFVKELADARLGN